MNLNISDDLKNLIQSMINTALEILTPHILYSNSSGENNITLNDNLKNYTRIDIVMRMTDGDNYETITLYDPANRNWLYSRAESNSANNSWYISYQLYANTETTITLTHNDLYVGHGGYHTNYNNEKIVKVIGYKY